MNGLILEMNLTALGMEKACNGLDGRRLPGTIGADEADDLSLVLLQRKPPGGLKSLCTRQRSY